MARDICPYCRQEDLLGTDESGRVISVVCDLCRGSGFEPAYQAPRHAPSSGYRTRANASVALAIAAVKRKEMKHGK